MDGLSNEVTFIIGEPDFSDRKEFDKKYDKEFQLHQLLVRNKSYIADIKGLRKKYSVGQFLVEGGKPRIDMGLDPEDKNDRKKFYEEVETIAAKIQFPGDWRQAVRRHTVGYDPEICFALYGTVQKKIIGKVQKDHVELKLYGDLTVPDLRSAAKKIRNLVTDIQHQPKTHGGTKYKPELMNNLVIFDMAERGVSTKEIAKYCANHGIKDYMQDYEVSNKVKNTRKQIEKIYA